MSETQSYKTVELTQQQFLNVVVALEDRENDLKREIEQFEGIGVLAKEAESDLEAVRQVLKMLGAK